MKKYKHVYCTCCIYGNHLMDAFDSGKTIPKSCQSCYPYDPEDSRSNYLRVNYRESLNGWWWLTKWGIIDFFKYKMWK